MILSQLNQRELVQARTVWKKWREVVDAHFEFTVIVHDGKADLDRIYNLRIRDCLITRLLGDHDICQYPSLLRRVRFWGPTNVNCFQRIMGNATAVEELSLTKFALMQENLIGTRRLNGFSKVKKLELLGYMCKDESRTIAENTSTIFSYDMLDLEKLTINFHCDISSINQIAQSFMEFLSRRTRLQNLIVSLIPEASHPHEITGGRTATITIPSAIEESLGNVQLSILRITTSTKDLPMWAPLLNSQTRLQDFRMNLSEGGFLTAVTAYVPGIPFDLVREPLLRNASTLTSVELKEIRLSTPQPGPGGHHGEYIPADASVFRYAVNLKKLILYRNSDDFRRFPQYPDQPSIFNLRMLPTSIEILEISRFYCLSEELQFVVDVLENLKTIVLAQTGNLNRLGVHGGIVESISRKSAIQTMNIAPLNYYCPIENKKYDGVKAKFEMNDGDHLYYDFERFRKGLPQPRPPVIESSYVPRVINTTDRTSPRFRRRHQQRQRKVTLARPCSVSSRCRADSLHRFEELLRGYRNSDFPCLRCRCDGPGPSYEGSSNNQCRSESNGSRLFHGLDLHLSTEQKILQKCSPSVSFRHCTRQRRWSGDGFMNDFRPLDLL